MTQLLSRYLQLPRSVYLLTLANFLLNLVNAALLLVFNIYLRKLGYDDSFIASSTAYRFLGVLLLALPFGIFIRGRKLKSYFLTSAALAPLSSWFMLLASEERDILLLNSMFLLWGVGVMMFQVSALPFLVRETQEETRTEAFSLSFSTWSLALIVCGVVMSSLGSIERMNVLGSEIEFDEPGILRLLIIISILGFLLVSFMNEKEPQDQEKNKKIQFFKNYDWNLIFKAVSPSLFIAVGAGLTIPFINLFFNSVFGLDFDQFGALGGCTGVLVFLGALLNPYFKRRFGYQVAITFAQSLAVIFLILLSLTEVFREIPGIFWVACFCYLLRQPLMNMAGPISSELTLGYVGERNRELVSALGSSIWSGSWFVSAKIFQYLRESQLAYWQIFMITAFLYSIGVLLYFFLIRSYESKRDVDSHVP